MKLLKNCHFTFKFLILFAIGILAVAAPSQTKTVADLQQNFQTPPDDARIMMRWWWFGPSVTNEEIVREMQAMKTGGIGGFELAVVYPMTLDDPSRGLKNVAYLSPEFLEKVRFTSQKAKEIGLRMDITIGSGWSFGGPYITPQLAAARLRSDSFEIEPSKTTVRRPVPYENEKLVAAFVGRGSKNENPNTFLPIDISGNGDLQIPAGDGPRTLVFYYSSQTGQIVKRSAVGAEGYVLDHYNKAAIQKHLQEAGDKLLDAAVPGSIYAIFCDSLEVYGGDWTEDLLPEFKKRRGYDLLPLLHLIEFDDADKTKSETVRRDFGKTLSELYEERFVVPMKEWAKARNVLFRIQNYGIPPATIASSRHADIIDGEGYHWRTLTATRWASSASHLFGKPVTSSESWTWIHSPAFRATPLDIKAEADQQFLNGVNQLIGHGWTYSPPQAGNPGWMFYAAGVLSDKNPWWAVMPDLSSYLQRVSYVLRQGEPVADIGLYAPIEDAWSGFKPGTPRYLNLWAKTGERIGDNIIPAILDAGYNFDLFDDGTIKEAEARKYKAIILPNVRFMPEATKKWLSDYLKKGGKVYAVNRFPEVSDLKLELVNEKDLRGKLSGALKPDVAMTPNVAEIGVVHRRLADADVYFLANGANISQSVSAQFNSPLTNAEMWNPMNGNVEKIAVKNGSVKLEFEPYSSRIVVFRRAAGNSPAAPETTRQITATQILKDGWNLQFNDTKLKPNLVNLPDSWTNEKATKFFSGTAVYTKSVSLPASFRAPGTRVFLDFGASTPIEREPLPNGTLRGNSFAALIAPPVREAAIVYVNGKRAGSLWTTPYKIEVTNFLQTGANEIKIEVFNTAVNTLAEGGKIPDLSLINNKYGLRTRLQDLDNLQPVNSGIMAVPKLTAEK
jgi:hypothetical protein